MERALVKQRAGIVQKQVAAGREFKVNTHMASVVIRLVSLFFHCSRIGLFHTHFISVLFGSLQGCAFYSKPEVIVFKVCVTQGKVDSHFLF